MERPDPRDGVAEVRERLDVLAQWLEPGDGDATPLTGADGSGTVRVTVGVTGDVAGVELDPRWRREVGVAGLAGAILGAVQGATALHMQRWARAQAERGAEPTARPRLAPPTPPPPTGQAEGAADRPLDAAAGAAALRALTASLDAVEQQLEAVSRQLAEGQARSVAGRGAGGGVEATVTEAGELIGVTFDREWLGSVDSATIGAGVTEAVATARRLAADGSPQSVLLTGEVGRLLALGDDQEAMTRYLRLGG